MVEVKELAIIFQFLDEKRYKRFARFSMNSQHIITRIAYKMFA